jgi:hypothetical protein
MVAALYMRICPGCYWMTGYPEVGGLPDSILRSAVFTTAPSGHSPESRFRPISQACVP